VRLTELTYVWDILSQQEQMIDSEFRTRMYHRVIFCYTNKKSYDDDHCFTTMHGYLATF